MYRAGYCLKHFKLVFKNASARDVAGFFCTVIFFRKKNMHLHSEGFRRRRKIILPLNICDFGC